MKRINLKAFYLCISLGILLPAYVSAQNIDVSGTVKNATTGEPLPGVSVLIKGTLTGTVSNLDGIYKLTVNSTTGSLIFSSIGFLTDTIEVNGRSTIDISLVEELYNLDELVVIGYGSQKKSDLTGAVSVVKTADLEKVVASDISRTLQGHVTGVQVNGSGEPGAIPQIKIRGIGSFQNTDPLYVIDGIPVGSQTTVSGGIYNGNVPTGGIADFNPSDIESVQVLKDASSCAIYGARGANGVIIITTKRGKKGDMKISYEGKFGVQNIVKRMDVTNRVQFQEMNNLARLNDGHFRYPANNPERDEFIDSIDTDWQKEVFRTGILNDHSLTLQGGNNNANYYSSFNYFDQSGTMNGPAPHYTRYSVKFNSDQKKGKFKFGQSIFFSNSEQKRLSNSQWSNPILETILGLPTVAVYDPDNIGGFGGGIDDIHGMIAGNEVGFNHLRNTNLTRYRFLGIVYGEYEILNGLSYKLNLSYDRSDWLNHEFVPVYNIGTRHTNPIAFLNEERGENPYMIMENTINYNKVFGNHNLAVVGGYTMQYDYLAYISGHAEGYQEPYTEVLSAGPDNQSTQGRKFEHAMVSYLGRVNYSYADRYFITGSLRRDYSSRFGPNNKYGDFPSFALGWKINNENFFNSDYINLLKLRVGYGKIGNEKIGDYRYETFLNNAATYSFNGVLLPAAIQTNLVDPSIRWEEKITQNIGLDVALFDNRIDFTVEYFQNNANDLLLDLPVPASTGTVTNPTTNAASMINKGFELTITYRKAEGEFHYDISMNLSTLKNEVTKLGKSNDPILTYMSKTEVGGSMGQIYGWDFQGIFQNTDSIANHAFQSASTQPGDCMFRDINGRDAEGNLTGRPDGVINDDDRKYLGSAFPKLTGGLNLNMDYKGFDLSIFFQGVYGNTIWNGVYTRLNSYQLGNYSTESYENYWRGENTSDKYPRLTETDANLNNRMSQRWLEDGSYLRLQNLQLGYNLPSRLLANTKAISALRIYVSSQNLLTFTKYTGFDPDVVNDGLFYRGQDNGSYPSPRTFLVGLKMTL